MDPKPYYRPRIKISLLMQVIEFVIRFVRWLLTVGLFLAMFTPATKIYGLIVKNGHFSLIIFPLALGFLGFYTGFLGDLVSGREEVKKDEDGFVQRDTWELSLFNLFNKKISIVNTLKGWLAEIVTYILLLICFFSIFITGIILWKPLKVGAITLSLLLLFLMIPWVLINWLFVIGKLLRTKLVNIIYSENSAEYKKSEERKREKEKKKL